MAAPSNDTGSSDCKEKTAAEAAWERFREAAWDPVFQRAATLTSAGTYWKSKQQAGEPSIREKIRNLGQDGNELQTTPEFRAHVAKKLDVILDNLITTSEGPLYPVRNKKNVEEEDGFRLFSSSVLGDCGRLERVSCLRPALHQSSSSDSESDTEWQRCQDAAVSATDVLKQSSLPSLLRESGQGQSGQVSRASGKTVKKTKRKAKGEDDSQGGLGEAAGNVRKNPGPKRPLGSSRTCEIIETVSRTEAVARKKKKKRRKAEAE